MKKSGKLSGNTFTVTKNGFKEIYSVQEKHSQRTREVGEDLTESYTHTTLIAYDKNGNRAGTIESGSTGNSKVLNTNKK